MNRPTLSRLPAIFLGHGNPLNAIRHNSYTDGWAAIGASIARPQAILCVSAHWYVPETAVTAMPTPQTIHDFGGFPSELYEVRYPAAGAPELAERVRELLSPATVRLDQEWGLDHGCWSVLCHMFPQADIPVVQLSMDLTRPPQFHYDIGRRLAALRDEGVLLIGSGNVVHNLRLYAWSGEAVEPYDWAVRFEQRARELIVEGDDAKLVDYESLGPDAASSIPTPDHYLPLLYVIGARDEGDPVEFPVDGIEGGSVSMLAARLGC